MLHRNVYSGTSKADDVQFILDLITKIGEEIPAADMNNVNIAGRGKHIKRFSIVLDCQEQATVPASPTSSSSTPERTDPSTGIYTYSGRTCNIHCLLIPDHFSPRAFPMVGSLLGPVYNNDTFWKFSESAPAGSVNNFDTAVVPTFSSTFEVDILKSVSF